MSYRIEVLEGGPSPIILADLENFDMSKDLSPYIDEVIAALDAQPIKSVYITDARHLSIDFSGLLKSLAEVSRGNALAKHPNIGRLIVVSESSLLHMGAKAMSQSQYGNVAIELFETLDEALTAAHTE